MNKQISDFLAFLKKNRVVIYVLLGTALLMQICSKGALPPIKTTQPQAKEITAQAEESYNPEGNVPVNKPNSQGTDYTHLLIMAMVILAFFVAKRYGWLDKLFPKVVIFKVDYYRQKTTGNIVLKVFIINKTNTSISFNNPSLVFFNGKQQREFTIKNIGGQNYFPITLTPGTGHKFNIDAQKFYANVEGLKNYKTLRMKITSTAGKTYKSLKWPVWLTYRRM